MIDYGSRNSTFDGTLWSWSLSLGVQNFNFPVPITKGCPTGWVTAEHFCMSPVRPKGDFMQTQLDCAKTVDGQVCSVGEYLALAPANGFCKNDDCTTNATCVTGSSPGVFSFQYSAAAKMACVGTDVTALAHHCCRSRH